ncbi:MAG TPA: ABC transporter permease, partial [Clostridiales bacterium]|nr:ABC transporter permease [Clostridiales bacterium]
MNLTNLQLFLSAAVIAGTPLLFATLGEIITEKAGNLNLGIEGMMLMGAVVGFITAYNQGNPILALIAAFLAGAFGSLIYAFLTVSLRVNHEVSGLALTTFGTGFAGFLGQAYVGKVVPGNVRQAFGNIKIPLLGDIPFIGEILFNKDPMVYLSYIVVIIIGIYLYRTRKGLNLKAIGENPAAADAAGINISLYKYVNILIGGALCGLGGAYLSLIYVPA